ncbi:MAG: FadR/GntR family transcriptional regulator [Sphingomonas sp.]|uniref:FadR/GntR family transcriptional regulator n=1 Tax=Sphingomonas sp. TaxID=28214 RepID=UPI003F7F3BC3
MADRDERQAKRRKPADPSAPMAAEISFHKFNRKARSNHDQVARTLGIDIISGVYAPGTRLPHETEVLERFGISRTVLREALKTLTAKGLIASKSRVGTKVLDATHWNLFDADVLAWKVAQGFDEKLSNDLAEIRCAIEPRAAALAAEHADKAVIAHLRRCIADMGEATDSRRRFAEADLEFHRAIGAASGNMLMRALSAVIETALVESFTLSSPVRDLARHEEVVRKHERIVDAIEARDPQGAAAAMEAVIVRGVKGANDGLVT